MAWLRNWTRATFRWANWHWVTLNVAGLAALIYLLVQGSTGWNGPEQTFDRMLASGKWGVRFLLLSLVMTPLFTHWRWSPALKLRKPAGLWAFVFGTTHFLLYAYETYEPFPVHRQNGTPWHWLTWPMQLYIVLGVIALGILASLALTSNKWSMRRLGKNWKRLHRLVYCAGLVIITHALLASTMSKKMTVLDPQAVPELRVYLGVLALLLVVRIPQVRSLLLKSVAAARPQARPVAPVTPSVLPSRTLPPRQSPTLDAMPDAIAPVAAPMREAQPNASETAEVRAREPVF